MRKYNLFNFLEKKIDAAPVVASDMMEQLVFKELALQIAISYIANSLSKCEIKTFENGDETKGLLYYLLNVSPNPNQNASQFINQVVENYFYNGHALVVMHNDKLYCADSFDIDDSNPLKDFIFYNVSFNMQQLKKRYKSSEVFYFKLDNKDVKRLIDLLYEQYGDIVSLALQTFKATNGRKYKLILEQYKAGDPNFAKTFNEVIRDQLKTFIENDNAVYPQFKGMDLQEFKAEAGRADTNDIIAMRKEIFDTTAQAFKIPLSMMYGNITNINEIVKVYLSFCIDPIADMLSEEFTRKRYTMQEWQGGNYVEVDTSCINYVDILEVASEADRAIASGLVSIDELRPRVRLKPLETDFSTSHFITKNYDLADNLLKNLKKEGGNDDEQDVLLPDEGGTERDNQHLRRHHKLSVDGK